MIFSMLVAFLTGNISAPDTADHWQVYYNNTRIEVNRLGTFVLKAGSIKSNDTITVRYFKDAPCYDCATHLSVEDEKHHIFISGEGKGTGNPIVIPVSKLAELYRQGYRNTFEIHYFEDKIRSRADQVLIFRIKIE